MHKLKLESLVQRITRTKVEVVALIGDDQEVQSCSLKRQKSGL